MEETLAYIQVGPKRVTQCWGMRMRNIKDTLHIPKQSQQWKVMVLKYSMFMMANVHSQKLNMKETEKN